MKQAIYQTRGRAKEFCAWALNIYSGCSHGCVYCYAPAITRKEAFHTNVFSRLTTDDIEASAAKRSAEIQKQPVLMSFTTDPYQPIEDDLKYTRTAIEILNRRGIPVNILTKAGVLPLRDLELLSRFQGNAFAETLTFMDPIDSAAWEPHAGKPKDRMLLLMDAYAMGIETWASLEPVIDPEQTLRLIEHTHRYVGHYKLGTLNYHGHAGTIDWKKYGLAATRLLRDLRKPYYIKWDLAKKLADDVHRGFWVYP